MSAGTLGTGHAFARRLVMPAVLALLTAGPVLAAAPAQAVPAAPPGTSQISAGLNYSCAIESGKAYCWGDNQFGVLGDGSTVSSRVPVAVSTRGVLAGKVLTQISAGEDHTCALDSSGSAYCWGWDLDGALGDGRTSGYSSVPVDAGVGNITQITAAGVLSTCALTSSGAAYCWGFGRLGELGNGVQADSAVPVPVDTSGVLAGKTLTQITGGEDHACALDSAGAAYCWGLDEAGQLGDGKSSTGGAIALSLVPVAVNTSGALAGKTLTQVAAEPVSTCALDSTGRAYCWGSNQNGQLGDGSITNSSVPVAVDTSGVLAGKTLTQTTGTCALDTAGAAYCWGYGALGDGRTASSSVPVAVNTRGVLAGKTLTQISTSSADPTCAVDSADAAFCWGTNADGQLGDNSTAVQSDVPVLTGPHAPTDVTAVPGDTTAEV